MSRLVVSVSVPMVIKGITVECHQDLSTDCDKEALMMGSRHRQP